MDAAVIVSFVLGLVVLIGGAELLVRGASRLALSLGVSPLVVGLTIVAYGTSAPEVAVSVDGVLSGRMDIAVGNVVGSNVFNILFILGLSALIAPLVVHRQVIRQEVPIMLGAMVLFLLFSLDGVIQASEAGLLAVLLIAYTAFLIRQSRREKKSDEDGPPPTSRWDAHWSIQVLLVLAGLALLVWGSNLLVDAATTIAQAFGVSDLVIGLTIVAAGTSLPEVATSITAALRGQRDIAVGNVIGSNTFNVFGGLGISGVVSGSGLVVSPSVQTFDIWFMLAVCFATLPIFVPGGEIRRFAGGIFLFYYIVYATFLILGATGSEALEPFTQAMTSVVAPLTVLVLLGMLLRSRPGSVMH